MLSFLLRFEFDFRRFMNEITYDLITISECVQQAKISQKLSQTISMVAQ